LTSLATDGDVWYECSGTNCTDVNFHYDDTNDWLSVGTSTSTIPFYLVRNSGYGMMSFPYETGVFEFNDDNKVGV